MSFNVFTTTTNDDKCSVNGDICNDIDHKSTDAFSNNDNARWWNNDDDNNDSSDADEDEDQDQVIANDNAHINEN